MQFAAIREVLQPLYKQVNDLEDELDYKQARTIAVQYAGLLKERLWEHRSTDLTWEHRAADPDTKESKTSVRHLIYMCDQIIQHAGYVPKEWSVTKLHRWIGYIQGVMTTRGLTTVERERADYKELKVLAELHT